MFSHAEGAALAESFHSSLGLMLAGSLLVMFVLGEAAVAERHWLLGIFAAIAAIGAASLAKLGLRLARRRTPAPLESSAGAAAFVTETSRSIGARSRRNRRDRPRRRSIRTGDPVAPTWRPRRETITPS
ncbi:hypothetical protein OV079_05855 [Nannocystis pusilla]|uniref:Uncharacterized protein n=1 Tax=Nannocystis pusilla TaxID=889268 RepID=A0A9X3EK15_9BACT|nr:hypothetical protein [Nannocystis pusilla]MCY1005101.1 hypothetical protein [Nannocystis pusilla]